MARGNTAFYSRLASIARLAATSILRTTTLSGDLSCTGAKFNMPFMPELTSPSHTCCAA